MKQFLTLRRVMAVWAIALSMLASTVAMASPALADGCMLPDGRTGVVQSDGHTCCPSGTTSGNSCLFAKYINPLVNLLSAAVGMVAVIAIIVGGIEYSTSAGDPQRTAAGRQHITNALIGLLAYLLLYGFLQFIIPGGLLNG
jgi:hypothetical protein